MSVQGSKELKKEQLYVKMTDGGAQEEDSILAFIKHAVNFGNKPPPIKESDASIYIVYLRTL